MKTHLTSILLVCIIASAAIILPQTSNAQTTASPAVGVKVGDWIEYNITVTGKGSMPPTHDVVHFRIGIFDVEGEAFSANFTCNYRNGTVGSAVWKYNFSEGIVGGWTIIPANLSPGMQFFDLGQHNHKPVNVTVQRQEDKTVLGATRTITYGNDSLRHKEWDKATGVMVGTLEVYKNVTSKTGWYIEDITVVVEAVATNMWSPQSTQALGDQTALFAASAAAAGAAAALLAAVVLRRRKRVKRQV
ncbi:MAG: hypothetical protein NWE93_13570 [Candidatus Bathyarchaeota archaeon]|nr:hypothetical protein [Candidatus Bathyarchaeota archaeon]